MNVFQSCEALEIYPNLSGGVTMRQECRSSGDDVHIVIPIHYIERTIRALRDMADAAADMNAEGRGL